MLLRLQGKGRGQWDRDQKWLNTSLPRRGADALVPHALVRRVRIHEDKSFRHIEH